MTTWPTPDRVLSGVQYGPTGAEFIGTLQGTVFASMFSVQIEQPSLTVTHRAKRQVQDAQVVSPPIRQSKSPKNVAVFSAVMSAVVFTAPDEITITQATQAVTMTTKQPSATITRKRRADLVQSA